MSENENNFESLRHLLALKRHEVPPPGYFDNLSSRVRQRIRAGQSQKSVHFVDELSAQAPWLGKLLQAFNVKPVFASGFAGALCLLLVLGIVYADRPDLTSQPLLVPATASTASLAALSPTALSQPADQIMSSTNPVLSLQPVAPALAFGQENPLAQPVSFRVPGN